MSDSAPVLQDFAYIFLKDTLLVARSAFRHEMVSFRSRGRNIRRGKNVQKRILDCLVNSEVLLNICLCILKEDRKLVLL